MQPTPPKPTPLEPAAEALRQQRLAADLPRIETLSVAGARAQLEALRAVATPVVPELHQMQDMDAEGVPVRVYRPRAGILPVIVFAHGGGWVLRTLTDYDPFCAHLARITGAVVVSVDYRLAPEHPFPAALNDTCQAITWVAQQAATLGVDATRLILSGDSAGGNLMASAALMARDGDLARPMAQVLFYPNVDATQSLPSHSFHMEGLMLSGDTMGWFIDKYCTLAQRSDWRVSPLLADDLTGSTPAIVMTVGADPLRDEGCAYAQRLIDAGCEVAHLHYPRQPHAFLTLDPQLAAVQDALARVAALLDKTAPL